MNKYFALILIIIGTLVINVNSISPQNATALTASEMAKVNGGCSIDCQNAPIITCYDWTGHLYHYKRCIPVSYLSNCTEYYYNICGGIMSCITPY